MLSFKTEKFRNKNDLDYELNEKKFINLKNNVLNSKKIKIELEDKKKNKIVYISYACENCNFRIYVSFNDFLNGKQGRFEFHHLDDNHSNNIATNLALLCESCHSSHHAIYNILTKNYFVLNLKNSVINEFLSPDLLISNNYSDFSRWINLIWMYEISINSSIKTTTYNSKEKIIFTKLNNNFILHINKIFKKHFSNKNGLSLNDIYCSIKTIEENYFKVLKYISMKYPNNEFKNKLIKGLNLNNKVSNFVLFPAFLGDKTKNKRFLLSNYLFFYDDYSKELIRKNEENEYKNLNILF